MAYIGCGLLANLVKIMSLPYNSLEYIIFIGASDYPTTTTRCVLISERMEIGKTIQHQGI